MKLYANHWDNVARFWDQMPSPLRPHCADIYLIDSVLAQWCSELRAPAMDLRALILGVTPEYWTLMQRFNAHTVGLDICPAMLKHVWPGPANCAIAGDWLNMPFISDTFDWVACDGGLLLLPYPQGQRQVMGEIARVLRLGGIGIIRLFTPAEKSPTLLDLELLLRSGTLSNSSELKLWLWSLLQEDATTGIVLHEIWQQVLQVLPNFERLLYELGWSDGAIGCITSYRNSTNRYHLVTLDEVLHMISYLKLGLIIKEVKYPPYHMGRQCPLLIVQKVK